MAKKNEVTTTSKALEGNYPNLLQELKSILDTGLQTAYKAVDNIKVQTYWQLGERIVREELQHKDRAEYGEYLAEKLSEDLALKKTELFRIIKFYNTYRIVATVSPQLSWSHYRELITVEDEKERLFYQTQAIQHTWSVRKLREKIRNNLYQNTTPEEIQAVFQTKLPETTSLEIFKNDSSAYDFGFFPLGAKYLEKDVEDGIMRNIDLFLKELGDGFGFFGRQVPIKIDGKTHNIDLVLFHKAIPCTILIDLKINKIDSRDIGQMNKYVSYWRKNCQYGYEKDAIGLVLSTGINNEEVAYALEDLERKIFVAIYKTMLPTDEALKSAVRKLL